MVRFVFPRKCNKRDGGWGSGGLDKRRHAGFSSLKEYAEGKGQTGASVLFSFLPTVELELLSSRLR